MAVMTCYFDASGTKSEVVVVPAGLVAAPEQWVKFDTEWNACLKEFKITALHTRDFVKCKEEFSSWRNDLPKRKQFLNHLMWIIENNTVYTAACGVLTADYKKVNAEYELSETMQPYTLGCLTAASSISNWAKTKSYPWSDFIWVFEKGDTHQDDLKRRWNIAYPNLTVEPIFLKKKDKYPDPKNHRPIRPFEAADLIAYEHLAVHRLLDEAEDGELFEDQVSPALRRMLKLPGAKEWTVSDEEGLHKLINFEKIPHR